MKRSVPYGPSSLFSAWSNLAILGIESQQVIFLRLAKIAIGGPAARAEMQRMTAEKVEAVVHEGGRTAMGASHNSTIRGYRRRVRANIHRLSR